MEDKLKQIQRLLDMAEGDLHSARNLLRSVLKNENNETLDIDDKLKDLNSNSEGKIVEGIFNGECMVGKDGKTYQVPANYASKSKLIEGDTLKLTISDNGSFIFKQIAPADRRKVVGSLVLSGNNAYSVFAEGKSFKILPASVTYYKGQPGDQATIILPKSHDSVWAALEGINKKETESVKIETSEQTTVPKQETIVQDRESLITTDGEDRKDDYILTQEKTIPIPADMEALTNDGPQEPEIEFPGNNTNLSNEDLLKNITSDLKKEIDNKEIKKEESSERTPISGENSEPGILDEFIKPIEEQPIYPTTDNENNGIKELEI